MNRRSVLKLVLGILFAPKALKADKSKLVLANGCDKVEEWEAPTNRQEAIEQARIYLNEILSHFIRHCHKRNFTEFIVVNRSGYDLIRYARKCVVNGWIPLNCYGRYAIFECIKTEYEDGCGRPDYYFCARPVILGKGFFEYKPQFDVDVAEYK